MIGNKPSIYNAQSVYNQGGGVYENPSVYNMGGNTIDGLMSLFYGDFKDGNYGFRYVDRSKIYQVTPNAGNTTSSYAISTTRTENTPLGNDTPIFQYGDPNSTYFLMGYFTPDAFKFGTFTTDFWWYCNELDYSDGFTSRFIASQIRIRDVSANNTRNLNFGPHSNTGVYYNLTSGARAKIFIGGQGLTKDWHHIEVDFDYANKIIKFYIDGYESDLNVASTPLYSLFDPTEDYFHASRVTNDSRNYPNVKITQLALWNKLMNGQCYSMGLYHDGNKFLI